MPLTNPWLAGPTPTGRLDRDRLEERILHLLSSQNMCVLATTGPDGPLATPVRYYPLGFAVLFTAAPRSPKMRNIAPLAAT
ncbi:Pyridoxamine 5'-phosphate oxidase [Micromonospora mirobrigensis]|uniref:Pyridoxamine 5'-phosphate oxidase n=1 Tax=Micromonospora mirobrigensis TaxID=262898 RepID=A0A1C4WB35_9ACTN|nr:Pyridoxamine 5'-phosphate oxidase [Micromonospora mirobrigensis]